MRFKRQNRNRFRKFAGIAIVLNLFFLVATAYSQVVTFHLRTGERLTGVIISENTNSVSVSNIWTKELSIPLAQIEKRETNVVATALLLSPKQTEVVATNAATSTTNLLAKLAATNSAAAASAISKTNLPTKPKPKLWHGEVRLGMDLLYGAVDRQIYNGRVKLTYAKPYPHTPSKFFRNTIDYLVEYGKADDVLSANRMEGSEKIDFDVGKKVFVYNVLAAGYDEIRKIDLRYELGPGVGYHLLALTNFVMNVEGGINYQVQERSVGEDVENFYFRLAEDFTWKINPKMTLTEKFEFFPRVNAFGEYRARFEGTLAFPLLKYISLNVSLIDLYDTQPAPTVSRNELQIRSAVVVTF